jgi:hypothetical protein
MGYTKITKSDKKFRFKIYILRSRPRRLLFLYRPKYEVFAQEFLHVGVINSWLHVNIFSIVSLKFRNMFFNLF